ncbi:DMT family transporter [Comamonas sp. J-3]|uniref:DMT family transporter n=1 Tax=Comamonas trifloxystrobinivorans TaxID=3350256 RepID=UPI00372C8148
MSPTTDSRPQTASRLGQPVTVAPLAGSTAAALPATVSTNTATVTASASAAAPSALAGIAFAVLSCALFSVMDGVTRYVGQVLPMLMVLWVRLLVQALVTTALVLPRQGLAALRTVHPRFQYSRALLGCMTSACGFFCILNMPLANFTATWSVVPLLLVAASALLYKEPVGWSRWLLLVIGLGAVLLIIRPEPGAAPLGWAVIYPIGMLVCGTANQLLGSRLARLDGPNTTQLYSNWIPVLLGAPLLPLFWQSGAPWLAWAALAAMGVIGAIGHLLLLTAYARTTPAVISPFLYSQIGFATLVGWAAFGQVPDTLSVVGMLLISFCGCISIWLTARERPARQ